MKEANSPRMAQGNVICWDGRLAGETDLRQNQDIFWFYYRPAGIEAGRLGHVNLKLREEVKSSSMNVGLTLTQKVCGPWGGVKSTERKVWL